MATKAKIAIIDDEPTVCRSCQAVLNDRGYEVHTHTSARIALEQIKNEDFDLALVDMKMPGLDGMQLLKTIREIRPEMTVIMISGYSTVENAVSAIRLGAYDYLPKPFLPDELALRVERALETKKVIKENAYLRREITEKSGQAADMVPANGKELKKMKKTVREDAVKEIEKAFVFSALKRNDWNITRAARDTGMQRQNFQFLMKKYQMKP